MIKSVNVDLAAAVTRYGRPNTSELEKEASRERASVLEMFPPQAWPDLPLERYALGAVRDPVPFCAMLEYHTPDLGSMKGGSARKHIIFRHNDGHWWMAGSLKELDVHEAWQRLRTEYVRAIESVTSGDLGSLDTFLLLPYGGSVVTKTLTIYAPEHFLPINSASHLRGFIELFGAEPEPDTPSWLLNRQLWSIVRGQPDFADWNSQQIMRFLYAHFDPRPDGTIIKIAPGEQGRMWSACLARNAILVGWDAVGSLTEFDGTEELASALQAAYSDMTPSYCRSLAGQLLRFRDLPTGTRVVANRGTSEVLGVGVVTDSGYQFDATLPEYKHILPVEWDVTYAQRLETPARGWVRTFGSVPPQMWAAIERGRSERKEPHTHSPSPTLPSDVQHLLDAVNRKGQVIVFGPPGTGKTRLALSAALVLTGRIDAVLGSPAVRASALQSILTAPKSSYLPQVTIVSFHPSLGYEDFVEGFKPYQTEHGGLALTLTDGIFKRICTAAFLHPELVYLLIIDEINRADLARVLGELVTLLEMDKRENVIIRLAASGDIFRVPSNVRIIGTMNTADRSVAHLDAAIRRRFGFVSVPPDPTMLEVSIGPLSLSALLGALNEKITSQISADCQIGHAYFMSDDEPINSAKALAAAYYQDIIPQLEDDALGDPDVLESVLGEELYDRAARSIVVLDPEELVTRLATEFSADAEAPHG